MRTQDRTVQPFVTERPWGRFEQFVSNTPCTVKILQIEAGQAISLQYHELRAEYWKVLQGYCVIVRGEKTIFAREGDEFFIPRGVSHRVTARRRKVEILEIAIGEFDEDDIVRLQDQYGRSR